MIDATGMTVVPLGEEGWEVGQIVDLPEWKAKAATTVAVGQAARLALLKPGAPPGKYQIELVLR